MFRRPRPCCGRRSRRRDRTSFRTRRSQAQILPLRPTLSPQSKCRPDSFPDGNEIQTQRQARVADHQLAFPQAVRRFSCLPPRQAGPLPCAKTTNSSEAQAPAILDHARGLPQGEGRTRPEDWRPSNGIAARCHRPFARLREFGHRRRYETSPAPPRIVCAPNMLDNAFASRVRIRPIKMSRPSIAGAGMISPWAMAMRAFRFVVIAAASLALLTAANAQGGGKDSKRAADVQTVEKRKAVEAEKARDATLKQMPNQKFDPWAKIR